MPRILVHDYQCPALTAAITPSSTAPSSSQHHLHHQSAATCITAKSPASPTPPSASPAGNHHQVPASPTASIIQLKMKSTTEAPWLGSESPQLPPSPQAAPRPSVSVEDPNSDSNIFPGEIADIRSEDLDDFKPEAGPGIALCEQPLTKVPRGRPTKKRKRKGDIRRPGTKHPRIPDQLPELPSRTTALLTMRWIGHYAPKCTRPHT